MEQHNKTIDKINHLWRYKEGDSEKGIDTSDRSLMQGQPTDNEIINPNEHHSDSEFVKQSKDGDLLSHQDMSNNDDDVLKD